MLELIYGTNDFLVFYKKRLLKESFESKYSSLEQENFNLNFDEFEKVIGFIKKSGLFSLAKLVFLEGVEKNEIFLKIKEFLNENLSNLEKNKNILLVFVTNEPKSKIVNYLLGRKVRSHYCPEFDYKNKETLIKILLDIYKKEGISLKRDFLEFLIDFFGYDGWLLKNEIDKLILYYRGEELNKEKVVSLYPPRALSNEVFVLAEEVLRGNKKKAVYIFKKLVFSGESETAIFNLLLSQFQNFLKIKYLPESKLKFKPFYIKKVKSIISSQPEKRIADIYKIISQEDLLIKTSGLNHQEALLDLFRKIRPLT